MFSRMKRRREAQAGQGASGAGVVLRITFVVRHGSPRAVWWASKSTLPKARDGFNPPRLPTFDDYSAGAERESATSHDPSKVGELADNYIATPWVI